MKKNMIIFYFLFTFSCNIVEYKEVCNKKLGNYSVLFEEVVFSESFSDPYGESEARIRILDNNITVFTSKILAIRNDGKELKCSNNVEFVDVDSSNMRFTLKGEEQEPVTYSLKISKDSSYTLTKESGVHPQEPDNQ